VVLNPFFLGIICGDSTSREKKKDLVVPEGKKEEEAEELARDAPGRAERLSQYIPRHRSLSQPLTQPEPETSTEPLLHSIVFNK